MSSQSVGTANQVATSGATSLRSGAQQSSNNLKKASSNLLSPGNIKSMPQSVVKDKVNSKLVTDSSHLKSEAAVVAGSNTNNAADTVKTKRSDAIAKKREDALTKARNSGANANTVKATVDSSTHSTVTGGGSKMKTQVLNKDVGGVADKLKSKHAGEKNVKTGTKQSSDVTLGTAGLSTTESTTTASTPEVKSSHVLEKVSVLDKVKAKRAAVIAFKRGGVPIGGGSTESSAKNTGVTSGVVAAVTGARQLSSSGMMKEGHMMDHDHSDHMHHHDHDGNSNSNDASSANASTSSDEQEGEEIGEDMDDHDMGRGDSDNEDECDDGPGKPPCKHHHHHHDQPPGPPPHPVPADTMPGPYPPADTTYRGSLGYGPEGDQCMLEHTATLSQPCRMAIDDVYSLRAQYLDEYYNGTPDGPPGGGGPWPMHGHHPPPPSMIIFPVFLLILTASFVIHRMYRYPYRKYRRQQINSLLAVIESNPSIKAVVENETGFPLPDKFHESKVCYRESNNCGRVFLRVSGVVLGSLLLAVSAVAATAHLVMAHYDATGQVPPPFVAGLILLAVLLAEVGTIFLVYKGIRFVITAGEHDRRGSNGQSDGNNNNGDNTPAHRFGQQIRYLIGRVVPQSSADTTHSHSNSLYAPLSAGESEEGGYLAPVPATSTRQQVYHSAPTLGPLTAIQPVPVQPQDKYMAQQQQHHLPAGYVMRAQPMNNVAMPVSGTPVNFI